MKAAHMVEIIWEIRPAPPFILSAHPVKSFSTQITQNAKNDKEQYVWEDMGFVRD